jgi:hypothetical protein
LPRRLKKTVLAALAVVCAASLPVMGVWVFQELYKKQLWDPRHAALVNGRPVLREQVEEVLKIGLYPPVAAESGEPGTITMRQILDKLIEEELVMQAAEREGLAVTDEEVEAFLDAHLGVWGCGGEGRRGYMCRVPRGEELESLKSALRRRILLEKAAYFAVGRRARREARDWERYLAEWSRAHTVPRVYEARALLAEKVPAALRVLRAQRSRSGGLARLEADLKAAGAGCIVSDPIMIDPSKASAGFPAVDLEQDLASASTDPGHLTGVLELEESYAVLEVLSEVDPPTAEEMVRAARTGYEGRVAEDAFRAFVGDLWAEADIEINPNFPGAAPATVVASRARPAGAGEGAEASRHAASVDAGNDAAEPASVADGAVTAAPTASVADGGAPVARPEPVSDGVASAEPPASDADGAATVAQPVSVTEGGATATSPSSTADGGVTAADPVHAAGGDTLGDQPPPETDGGAPSASSASGVDGSVTASPPAPAADGAREEQDDGPGTQAASLVAEGPAGPLTYSADAAKVSETGAAGLEIVENHGPGSSSEASTAAAATDESSGSSENADAVATAPPKQSVETPDSPTTGTPDIGTEGSVKAEHGTVPAMAAGGEALAAGPAGTITGLEPGRLAGPLDGPPLAPTGRIVVEDGVEKVRGKL